MQSGTAKPKRNWSTVAKKAPGLCAARYAAHACALGNARPVAQCATRNSTLDATHVSAAAKNVTGKCFMRPELVRASTWHEMRRTNTARIVAVTHSSIAKNTTSMSVTGGKGALVKVVQRLLGGKREGKQTKTEVDAVEHVGAVQDLKDEQDDCAEDERAKHWDSPPVCVFTACVCRVEV